MNGHSEEGLLFGTRLSAPTPAGGAIVSGYLPLWFTVPYPHTPERQACCSNSVTLVWVAESAIVYQ